MPGRLAIIACGGALPVQIAAAFPDAFVISLAGVDHQLGARAEEHHIERFGGLFAALRQANAKRLVFAGSLARPLLDPDAFDAETRALAPRVLAAMQAGDDGLLRQIIAIFEEQGLQVVGAHDLLPELTASGDLQVGTAPDTADLADAERGCDILKTISPLDLGQGCVVAGGQCLGIETLQGTDALLGFVAATPAHLRRGFRGVYVKAAKAGQDLRVDLPAIGPKTIEAVANAGLAGVMVEAGRVMILEREKTLQMVADRGLFLMATTL